MFIFSVHEMILKVVWLPGACLFANLGVSQMKSKTGPCTQGARRGQRKRRAAPDGQEAVLVSNGALI